MLLAIYKSEIKKTLSSRDEEVIHGNIMMIKILLTYAKEEVNFILILDIHRINIGTMFICHW